MWDMRTLECQTLEHEGLVDLERYDLNSYLVSQLLRARFVGFSRKLSRTRRRSSAGRRLHRTIQTMYPVA